MAQQEALGFFESQVSFIEREAYQTQYPSIQYPSLVPVDTSAPPWIRSITHYSTNQVGQAEWFTAQSQDVPLADVTRDQHMVGVEMAAIGYAYTVEEIEQARMVGISLTGERVSAARRAAEEYIDNIVINGDASQGWNGLINMPSSGDAAVTAVNASGAGAARNWTSKTPDEIIADVNTLLSGMYESSRQVEMANTLLLPIRAFTHLASRRLTDTSMTVMQFIEQSNVYRATTGNPLMIRAMRGLETSGSQATLGRAIAYMRDPSVLRLHLPMPHRFLTPYQDGPLRFVVPGIFRLGGLEIRRPGAMRYMDGVLATT